MFVFGAPSQPSSFEPVGPRALRIRWSAKTIQIALSSSFKTAPAIISGSDVEGAVRRALDSWSVASGINFVLIHSDVQSISPVNFPDGINLITVASSPENVSIFRDGNNAARTRVFFDTDSGEINEADIAINPFPYTADGAFLQFSTNGTDATYDLESTLTHEIGHLLGLGHSHIAAATMQTSQGLNGTYGFPAVTERSLSDADRVAIRSLYGPCEETGELSGRIVMNSQAGVSPVVGAHVWLEDTFTGRVAAGAETNSAGRYNFTCLPRGDYRAIVEPGEGNADGALFVGLRAKRRVQAQLRTTEISAAVRITPDKPVSINYVFGSSQNSKRKLDVALFGTNGELSTVPIPAQPGGKITLFVSGTGIDQVLATGFSSGSPFLYVDQASVKLQQVSSGKPVVSFDVLLAPEIPPGDYSIRLQSNSGETAYLAGAITVNPEL